MAERTQANCFRVKIFNCRVAARKSDPNQRPCNQTDDPFPKRRFPNCSALLIHLADLRNSLESTGDRFHTVPVRQPGGRIFRQIPFDFTPDLLRKIGFDAPLENTGELVQCHCLFRVQRRPFPYATTRLSFASTQMYRCDVQFLSEPSQTGVIPGRLLVWFTASRSLCRPALPSPIFSRQQGIVAAARIGSASPTTSTGRPFPQPHSATIPRLAQAIANGDWSSRAMRTGRDSTCFPASNPCAARNLTSRSESFSKWTTAPPLILIPRPPDQTTREGPAGRERIGESFDQLRIDLAFLLLPGTQPEVDFFDNRLISLKRQVADQGGNTTLRLSLKHAGERPPHCYFLGPGLDGLDTGTSPVCDFRVLIVLRRSRRPGSAMRRGPQAWRRRPLALQNSLLPSCGSSRFGFKGSLVGHRAGLQPTEQSVTSSDAQQVGLVQKAWLPSWSRLREVPAEQGGPLATNAHSQSPDRAKRAAGAAWQTLLCDCRFLPT